jgi:hypothetical protein
MVMKDKREFYSQPAKKRYQKPEIRRIHLRPEEAVLGTCKTAVSYGPGAAPCATLACSSIGS